MDLIELKDVSVIRGEKYILKSISWKVKLGENWAVIGQNGAGKSFLLRLLSANLHPSEGKVRVFGHEFGNADLWELKKKIGFVSDTVQKEYKESSKVIDVICSGYFSSNGIYDSVTSEMRKSALRILKLLGIPHLKDRIFGELSSGEQRKAIIGRSLVFKPKILILDEPCAGLDIPTKEDFLKTIDKLALKGHNIIIVTHHIEEIITSVNHVLVLKNGRIFAKGLKKDVIKEKLLTSALGYKLKIVKSDGRYWSRHF